MSTIEGKTAYSVDARHGRAAIRVTCSRCGAHETGTDKPRCPAEVISKHFTRKGWRITNDGVRAECPTCSRGVVRRKILLLGQAPAQGKDGCVAFQGTRSGANLARYMGLQAEADLFRLFDTLNVLSRWPGKGESGYDLFPLAEAREELSRKMGHLAGRKVVALGGAAKVLGLGNFFEWQEVDLFDEDGEGLGSSLVCAAPHPSGGSRWWNTNRSIGEEFFRKLAAEAESYV